MNSADPTISKYRSPDFPAGSEFHAVINAIFTAETRSTQRNPLMKTRK
jgi:hypothetical protein